MTTRLNKAEYQLLADFRYALRQFLHFSEASARAAGIEPQQHQALLAIKGFPERDKITISELAERLQIKHHSAVGLASRLVANGFAMREANPDDRRQVFLALTRRGEALLEQLTAVHKEELRRLGPEIHAMLARLHESGEQT
ncbi:MAG TPA: MarR family transcriptional regulator [Roseiflexaceae bacterium]|jgi:DNA-binding MarR family transcriptional regulator|nr:MarR family transcriptional regulator [Roseiflexaceae bacterium]